MEIPQENNKTLQEVCTITILFPIESDDHAIDVKKKIGAVLKEVPDVMVDFRIRGIPKHGPSVR